MRLNTAIDAVRQASLAAKSVQHDLGRVSELTKDDRSPVTVADFAAQAIAEAVDSVNVTAALAEVTAAERPSALRILHQRARNSAPLLLKAITADSDSSLARHNADIR